MLRERKKTQIVGVRFLVEEKDLLERAAKRNQMSLSEWIREVLISTAGRRDYRGIS
jgi:hypothetical protein